jgi:hypothetical protein
MFLILNLLKYKKKNILFNNKAKIFYSSLKIYYKNNFYKNY